MAIDALQDWKDTLAALPKVADNSWAMNFATWYADRIVNIEPDSAALSPVGFLFTFPVAVFASALQALTPTTSALSGITGFADAWETAILTILYPATLSVSTGTFVPTATPATTFSIISTVVLQPASIALAKAKIIELATASPVDDPQNSEFPVKFRDATLMLKIDITGTNSVVPTPAPLSALNVPLI